MRKYTVDAFCIMRRKKASKMRAFFLEVYKERLKKRFVTRFIRKKRKYITYIKSLNVYYVLIDVLVFSNMDPLLGCMIEKVKCFLFMVIG